MRRLEVVGQHEQTHPLTGTGLYGLATEREINAWVEEDERLQDAAIQDVLRHGADVVLRAMVREGILREGSIFESWSCEDQDADA